MPRRAMEAYRIASVERALLELTKLGEKSRPALDKLLTHAESTDRIVRQGVLLAMVQAAERPCEKCEKRLRDIIEAQKDQSTLNLLTSDTRVVLHYFMGGPAEKSN